MGTQPHIPKVLFTTELSEQHKKHLGTYTTFSYKVIPFIKVNAIDSYEWSDDVPFETDAWVFTSKRAVEAVLPLKGLFLDPDLVFAVGEKTAEELKKYEIDPLIPEQYNVIELSKLIAKFEPPEIVHFCGNLKVESLSSLLASTPIDVVQIPVYETILTSNPVHNIAFDAIVFMSPSAITSFFQKNTLTKEIPIFCIGKSTAQALHTWGFGHYHQPTTSTFDSLVESIHTFYS